jgi:hypothetical protein
VSAEEALQCVKKLKIYLYWRKWENVSENIFKMTDDIKNSVQKGMLTKLKQRKFKDFFSVK